MTRSMLDWHQPECEDAIGNLNLEGFNEILHIVHGAPPNIPVVYANAC